MTVLLGVATRLRLARLLLISDLRTRENDLPEFIASTIAGGVDIVQLRDLDATDGELAESFMRVRDVVLKRGKLLGLYDALDVAQRIGADMLQLSERGPVAIQARRHVHAFAQIGRSCHSIRQLDAALADPAVDFLTVGPVYGGLPMVGGGMALIHHAVEQAPPSDLGSKPWFAVGGITADNIDEVLEAGARRVAVSRAITDADDPKTTTKRLKNRLTRAWNEDPGMSGYGLRSFGPQGS